MTNNKVQQNSTIRPPVVVVLGHVDHGKTKLLDTIRDANVVGKESGGITQHIGAYQIETSDKQQDTRKITFLDTPGHEAFTAIRSRGAKVADIAILVVAADEGVKPQTKEAIKIIKEEKIQVIVAINKIDKPGADSQKIKQELASEEILVEDWGGDVPVVEISAKENKNIDELLNMILLVAELGEYQEDISLPVKGIIIESNINKGMGYVATALVQKGVLMVGDWIVVGRAICKVRSMEDFRGKAIDTAKPSQPVLITGWSSAPVIGQEFISTKSKKEAVNLSEESIDLTPLFSFLKDSEVEEENKKFLNIILKTDVSSSLEAIESSLSAIKSDEVGYRVVGYDIGNVTESDVKMAVSSSAIILGFRVNIEPSAINVADKSNIKIHIFSVIYELIEQARKEMSALLDPEIKRIDLGKLKVLALFKQETKAQIVGGKVTSGKIEKGALVDVVRGKDKVLNAKIGQLQQNKNATNEVKEGLEAGLKLDYLSNDEGKDIREGDVLEVYKEERIQRSL
jgi:translation initiation factor IF-2